MVGVIIFVDCYNLIVGYLVCGRVFVIEGMCGFGFFFYGF